jgi:hypothetical protein
VSLGEDEEEKRKEKKEKDDQTIYIHPNIMSGENVGGW